MGSRGPKPQPKAIAKKKGVYQPVRHDDKIADAGQSLQWVHNIVPTPPDDLGDVAQRIWTAQLMEAQKIYGYISFIDLTVFKEYCYVYGEMEHLKGITSDRYYKDENGVRRLDPLYLELNKIRKDFVRLSQLFGFDPSSRTRITLEQKNEIPQDPYSDGI